MAVLCHLHLYSLYPFISHFWSPKRSTLGRIWSKSSYQTRFDGRIRNGPAFFLEIFLRLVFYP
jgi:hypothetical protein